MPKLFDFEQILKDLQSGKYLTGKDGFFHSANKVIN